MISVDESLSARRAWIEIGRLTVGNPHMPSLSARRAWIEMLNRWTTREFWPVALRKESVDRNANHRKFVSLVVGSLSARRAWIEMPLPSAFAAWIVSLSARRAWIEISVR